jgi:hypothetical protein
LQPDTTASTRSSAISATDLYATALVDAIATAKRKFASSSTSATAAQGDISTDAHGGTSGHHNATSNTTL